MPEAEDRVRAAEEALRASHLLLDNGLWSDAISRAYYAMVYAARALLATKGLEPTTHRGTVHLFGREFVRPGTFSVEVAKSLTAAMALRDRADYGMRDDLTERDARRTVEAAQEFVAAAKQALGRAP